MYQNVKLPVSEELDSNEVRLAAPKIMQYVKEGTIAELPEFVIVMGPISSDKTSFIQKKFMNGFVWLDVFRIYSELKQHCGVCSARVNTVAEFTGIVTLELAMLEKRSIVVEIIGADYERLKWLISKVANRGYRVNIINMNVDAKNCFGDLPINASSPYTEEILTSWFRKVFTNSK